MVGGKEVDGSEGLAAGIDSLHLLWWLGELGGINHGETFLVVSFFPLWGRERKKTRDNMRGYLDR